MTQKALYGLVLAGGQSRRMGRDKALLSYGGKSSQLVNATSMLSEVCSKVFVSQRRDQSFPKIKDVGIIYDSNEKVKGPLCGILSSMQAFPNAHWLVIACDLPFINVATLEKLVEFYQAREPFYTAYRSTKDGLPEPLCAIYPSGSDIDLEYLVDQTGNFCPRKLLMLKNASLVDQELSNSLDNINTYDEFVKINTSKSCR